jgi:hypothetical protein
MQRYPSAGGGRTSTINNFQIGVDKIMLSLINKTPVLNKSKLYPRFLDGDVFDPFYLRSKN